MRLVAYWLERGMLVVSWDCEGLRGIAGHCEVQRGVAQGLCRGGLASNLLMC